MDIGTIAAAESSFKSPVHEVIDLISESENGSEGGVVVNNEKALRDAASSDLQSEDENEAEGSDNLSLLEDILEEMGDEDLFNGEPDACTLEEARALRLILRTVGPEQFCQQTVENDSITAKKLLTAFGIRPPPFFEGAPDDAYYHLLSLAIHRELSKRVKLPQYNSIDDAVELLKSSKNIIVLTGAGISTSLGIPDFRSKDIGLYTKLEHLGLADPQDVFDIELFRQDPTIFYTIAKDILPSTNRFSPTHAFIRLLQDKGKLLTNYSQNIDNIEAKAGISLEKLIQCHGSFATASCINCHAQVPGSIIFPDIKAGNIPRCQACPPIISSSSESMGMKRKRSRKGDCKKRQRRSEDSLDSNDEDEDDNIPEAGVMKPDITFFGEALPDTFHERLTKHDKDLADLVIVIGTSLKVAPVSEVVPFLPAHIPQMYISRTPVSHVEFDIDMLGDCDVVIAELCRQAGWNLEHEMLPECQKVDVKPQEGFLHRHIFKEVKQDLNGSTIED